MYPLNLTNAALGGYAVANDESEHAALSDAGYEPKLTKYHPDTISLVIPLPERMSESPSVKNKGGRPRKVQ